METFEEQLRKAIEQGVIVNAVLEARRSDPSYKYEKALGKLAIDPSSAEIKEDAVFWIASCTKLLTSIAALQMVQRGLVTLDEPVSRIFPELAHPDVLMGFDATLQHPKMYSAQNAITLRRLLTHTSGMGYTFSSEVLNQWRKLHPIDDPKRDIVQEYLMPLTFEPGRPGHWQYSVGIDWAGKIVERLNGGIKLGDYMEENIFKPLGMTDTTFRPLQRKDLMDRMCPRVAREADGSLKMDSMEQYPVIEPVDDAGGGGLYSTAADYIKVLESLLRDDGKLLDSFSRQLLFQPQLTIDESLQSQSDHAAEKLQESLNQTGPGSVLNNFAWDNHETILEGKQVNLNHGLGGLVAVDGVDGAAGEGMMCWDGLPSCFWWVDRKRGTCGFYGSQIFPAGDRKTAELFGEFRKAAYNAVA